MLAVSTQVVFDVLQTATGLSLVPSNCPPDLSSDLREHEGKENVDLGEVAEMNGRSPIARFERALWKGECGQDAWAVTDSLSSGLGQWLAVAAEPIGGGNLVSFLKVPNVLINGAWKVLPFMYDVDCIINLTQKEFKYVELLIHHSAVEELLL